MNRPSKLQCRLAVVLVLLFAFFAARPATGQVVVSETERVAAQLPAQSRAVVERLLSLDQLPATAWKMHSGDLTHGEAVGLDESDWQPEVLREKAPTDAVWFRQTVQVPDTLNGYDLSGVRIWFQFHADANGPMPQMINYNGRRVAMGEDLEPIVLEEDARPGDKIVIAVKLLSTIDTKTFRGANLRIEFPQNRPNPEDLVQEFLSASVLLPGLTPANAEGKMNSMATLNSAIAAVDVSALDAAETATGDARAQAQSKFDASLKAAQRASLRCFARYSRPQHSTSPATRTLDAAWLWPSTETVDVVRRTFGTALQLMNEYPGYTYTQSAASLQRVDGPEVPFDECGNQEAHRRGPLGDCRWHVGRA